MSVIAGVSGGIYAPAVPRVSDHTIIEHQASKSRINISDRAADLKLTLGANAYSVTNGSSTKFVSNTNIIIYDQLDGNTTYNFTVTSYNDTLAGGSSSITSITTAPDEVSNVQLQSVTDTTATLTWNAVDGASKYVVTNGSSTQNTETSNITFSGLIPI